MMDVIEPFIMEVKYFRRVVSNDDGAVEVSEISVSCRGTLDWGGGDGRLTVVEGLCFFDGMENEWPIPGNRNKVVANTASKWKRLEDHMFMYIL